MCLITNALVKVVVGKLVVNGNSGKSKTVLYFTKKKFDGKFNYCTLMWMLHIRDSNDKIKYFYERYLLIIKN